MKGMKRIAVWLVVIALIAGIAHTIGEMQTREYMEYEFIERQLVPYDKPRVPTVDHMQLISTADEDVLARGKEVYQANCVVCHGEDGQLAVGGARKFGQEPFQNTKFGGGNANPLSMFDTLTNGWKVAMPAQSHLSPEDRYAVIHYVRQTFLYDTQYLRELDEDYLAELAAKAPTQAEDTGPVQVPGVDFTHPLDEDWSVPILGVMAERAQATAKDEGLQQSAAILSRAGTLALPSDLRESLLVLAGTEPGRHVVMMARFEDREGLAQVLTAPTTRHLAPRFGLLRQQELDAVYQGLRQLLSDS